MPAGALGAPIDAEVVTLLDENAARKLDTRIRLTAGTVRDNFAKLQDYVHEAKTGEIHRALGFKSWTAYLADALGEQPLIVDREQRRELVEYLSNEGMGTRAIASITGVNQSTISRDRAGDANASRQPITGRDGKEYAPKPRPAESPRPVGEDSERPAGGIGRFDRLIAENCRRPSRLRTAELTFHRIVTNAAMDAELMERLVQERDLVSKVLPRDAREYRQILSDVLSKYRKLDSALKALEELGHVR